MLAAAALVAVGLLLTGCGTTPGRDQPLEAIFEAVASPDGRLIAASTIYDEVALFDRAPLRFAAMLTRENDRHERRANEPQDKPFPLFSSPLLAFTPDGTTLVAAGIAGRLVAWDLSSRTERFRVDVGNQVLAMAVMPHGLEIVTVGPDAVIWNAKSGERMGQLTLPAGTQAMSAAISPDGRVVLIGLSDGRVAVFETASRELLRTLAGHSMPVYGVAFAPDGSMFASTAGQYDPRIWRADPKGEFTIGEGIAGRAASAAQASQGPARALGGLLWILGTVAGVHAGGGPIMGAPPMGSIAAARVAKAPERLPDPKTCAPHVAFSPDGRYLVTTGSFPGVGQGSLVELGLQVFRTELSTGATINGANNGCSIAFTPDSRFIIIGTGLGGAPVFRRMETLEVVKEAPAN